MLTVGNEFGKKINDCQLSDHDGHGGRIAILPANWLALYSVAKTACY